MKMVVVWRCNPEVPHHVIAVVSAFLISAVSLGLYNRLRDCWQQWPHIYPRLPLMPVLKQVAPTHQLETLHLDLPSMWNFYTFLFLGKHCSTLSFDEEIKQSSFFNFPKLPHSGLVTAKVDKSFPFVSNCSINQLHKACWMEADKSLGYREHERKQPGFLFCCSGFHTH